MSITLSSSTDAMSPVHTPSRATRLIALGYGIVAYLVFMGTFLYAIGFVSSAVVPKSINTGPASSWSTALLIDLVLMSIFAVQHSGMARSGFKTLFARFALAAVERSTFVLLASLSLILLFWQWRPLPAMVWHIEGAVFAGAATVGGVIGWLIVLYSTFLISHFELFGLNQVITLFLGRLAAPIKFKTPGLYRLIRHPIYLGFIIAFWSTPLMSVGQLLFASVTTAYIFVGIWLEERDLVALFGDEYRKYRQRVAMLLPGLF